MIKNRVEEFVEDDLNLDGVMGYPILFRLHANIVIGKLIVSRVNI